MVLRFAPSRASRPTASASPASTTTFSTPTSSRRFAASSGCPAAPTATAGSCRKGHDMSLALYGHPFSSYTQKVLIALYENQTPFEFRCIGPETPEHVSEWLRRWPIRKFPLLLD